EAASTWTYDAKKKEWSNEYGEKYKGEVKVDGQGNLHYYDGAGETVERTDGKKEVYPPRGGERIEDAQGRVVQMTDANGETYKFEYASPDAKTPSKVSAPDGTIWTVDPTATDASGYP